MARTTDDQSEAQTQNPAVPTPNPGLRPLNKLVGRWKVSGEADGELTYEWMEGGFFLIARGDTEQGGKRTRHMEIIGYDHNVGAEPAEVLTSRLYTSTGTLLATRTRSTTRV